MVGRNASIPRSASWSNTARSWRLRVQTANQRGVAAIASGASAGGASVMIRERVTCLKELWEGPLELRKGPPELRKGPPELRKGPPELRKERPERRRARSFPSHRRPAPL